MQFSQKKVNIPGDISQPRTRQVMYKQKKTEDQEPPLAPALVPITRYDNRSEHEQKQIRQI